MGPWIIGIVALALAASGCADTGPAPPESGRASLPVESETVDFDTAGKQRFWLNETYAMVLSTVESDRQRISEHGRNCFNFQSVDAPRVEAVIALAMWNATEPGAGQLQLSMREWGPAGMMTKSPEGGSPRNISVFNHTTQAGPSAITTIGLQRVQAGAVAQQEFDLRIEMQYWAPAPVSIELLGCSYY